MTGTKDRIMAASAERFRRQGYTGTGLKQIVRDAEAPFGSLYHFFPGGKEQLGTEVIASSGAHYQQVVEAVLTASPDLVSGIGNVFSGAAEVLAATDYADACPIATIALEVASTSEPMRQATAEVFERWITVLSAHLTSGGIARDAARPLAISTLALLEGAFVFARAMRSTAPVEIAGRSAVAAVRAALPAS